MYNPHWITKKFEFALCEYTGARYACAVNSCTMALLLACAWLKTRQHPGVKPNISIPKHTYCSVPMSILNAGCNVKFRHEEWKGAYQLKPYSIWDCARRFTSGMYVPGQLQCCSFHSSKILSDTQGGCLLYDNPEADVWFRKARFDGRTEGVPPKDDEFIMGWHCYMSPDVAARLLWKLQTLPKHNEDLPNDDYPDLSLQRAFQ